MTPVLLAMKKAATISKIVPVSQDVMFDATKRPMLIALSLSHFEAVSPRSVIALEMNAGSFSSHESNLPSFKRASSSSAMLMAPFIVIGIAL